MDLNRRQEGEAGRGGPVRRRWSVGAGGRGGGGTGRGQRRAAGPGAGTPPREAGGRAAAG